MRGGRRRGMTVQQAFRYELAPTRRQANLLARAAGTARFAFNWALNLARALIGKGLPVPSAAELHRAWNVYKRENAPWWDEVSKCAPQEALRDLHRAFENFFASRQGKRAGPRVGFPRFRKKGRDDRFRLTGAIRVGRRAVKLPRIGWVRTKEETTKFRGRVLSATVRREADRWYVSLAVEVERPDARPANGGVVGVDLGLKAFAVLSDGMIVAPAKALGRALRALRHRSKAHSRKQRGSKRRRKSALALARLHRRVRNRRQDFHHQLSTRLTKTKSVIVIEDLAVKNMVRNRHLSRAVSDAGWGEFRRMLEYKGKWYGCRIVVANRFYPSSKTCSGCGAVKTELPLSERVFTCETCGLVIDRDLNAAINLEHLAQAV